MRERLDLKRRNCRSIDAAGPSTAHVEVVITAVSETGPGAVLKDGDDDGDPMLV